MNKGEDAVSFVRTTGLAVAASLMMDADPMTCFWCAATDRPKFTRAIPDRLA
ncbi:MAG: hypothetical protein RKP46_13325 [Candidatus Accumulibacter sp.]|uniref:hypothetical protein n=1 Tax=Accumulibacter sp. TaxID=2053492 RepID=UPI0028783768|nr:hypothetical protein [Accumulibacter sp.]MDS4015308.1 hypothetical protein [Accumulibacter sp.]